MKRIIRLTESDLHRIIKNSVKRILKEDSTFDNHIVGNIYDDIIQRGLYRRLQPNKLKDFIMNSYGLKTSEEGIANTVVDKIMKYKTEMETQYGLTEANWSNAYTDPWDDDTEYDENGDEIDYSDDGKEDMYGNPL
jgi:hypothetical protein